MIEKVEMWDILDENGNKTGKLHKRGEKMNDNEYHIIVQSWIKNSNGEFIITKRSPNHYLPNLWECSGGSAIAGEDSLAAVLRETKEEIGIALNPDKGKIIYSCKVNGSMYNGLLDVWLFCEDIEISDVILQEGETCAVKWATKDDILKIINDGEFINLDFMNYIYDMFKKY